MAKASEPTDDTAIEAEELVLSALLQGLVSLSEFAFDVGDFTGWRIFVFSAICQADARFNALNDSLTAHTLFSVVANILADDGTLDEIGGMSFLAAIYDKGSASPRSTIFEFADVLRMSRRRRMLRVLGRDLATFSDRMTPAELIGVATRCINDICSTSAHARREVT